MEQMPMWCPPTPPTTDNDVYIDYSLGFLYDNTPMSEAQLPPIYVKKERKRCRVDVGVTEDGCRPAKMRHQEESVYAPKSLFYRPLPSLMKMRREMKMYRYRTMVRPPVPAMSLTTSSSSHTKAITAEPDYPADWMINEDWLLLQAIQVYQAQPTLPLMSTSYLVHNWDLVADIVNNGSRLFRSFKQCRTRYETVVEPREEGKPFFDAAAPKKQKKQKGNVYKTPQAAEQQNKGNRPTTRTTSQLYNQDKNQSFTQMAIQRFDLFKMLSNKRTPSVKPMVLNPTMKNANNAAVLADYGIQYDNPLTPMEVADIRTERINKEKVLTPLERQQHVAARLMQQQKLHQQMQQLQQQQQTQQQAGQQVASSVAAPQVHQLAQSAITTVANSGGIAKVATSSATLNNVATGGSSVVTTVKARPVSAGGQQVAMQDARTTSAVASPGNVQTAQRIATASLVSAGQGSAATATAAAAAAAAAQKGLVNVTLTGTSSTTKMTPAQIQYFRQHHMLMRQQQMKMREGMNVSGNTSMASVLHAQGSGGQKVSVAVSATAAQQRAATLMKQSIAAGGTVAQTAVGKQTVARTVSETEMAALIKRQALQQQAKAAAVAQVQVPAQAGLTPAQIFAQAGLQVQQAGTSASGTPVATLVKTANVAGVRAATPQQIRQLALHPQLLAQRKLPAQKVAQLAQVAGKTGVQTQLIVQQKSLSATMTVQQIQQVMKHVQPSAMQQFTHVSTGQAVSQASQVVLAKSPLQTRVIPVASGALKQTIQVVTAGNAQLRQTTPIQGKPVASSTIRRSPGPSPGPSPIPGSSTTSTAAGAGSTSSPGTASASTMSSAATALSQVRLQGITHSQQQQPQQQQQAQQDTQPK